MVTSVLAVTASSWGVLMGIVALLVGLTLIAVALRLRRPRSG
jgi:hypothetical protein